MDAKDKEIERLSALVDELATKQRGHRVPPLEIEYRVVVTSAVGGDIDRHYYAATPYVLGPPVKNLNTAMDHMRSVVCKPGNEAHIERCEKHWARFEAAL